MASMLTVIEHGNFFNERGQIDRNLPVDYIKAKSWELRPRVKAPQPEAQSMFVDNHSSSHRDTMDGTDSSKQQPNQNSQNVPQTLENDQVFDDESSTVETQISENAFYSIDGERYPAQDIKARVLHKMVTFFY